MVATALNAKQVRDQLDSAADHLLEAVKNLQTALVLAKEDYADNAARPADLLGAVRLAQLATGAEMYNWDSYYRNRIRK